ncbi:MAG: hypothetical protein KME13_16335 [Myxacorys californica WJT36-NPBG1]|jgi:hypothetical protein|nr:hypothetical protein [Myxacorys californica WJT36-NPBG1]
MQAIEAIGTIDAHGHLSLDQPLQVSHSGKVRVIVLLSDNEGTTSNGNGVDQTESSQQLPSLPPFLQFVEEISAQVPKEEWEKLPSDLSKNVDHYLYGSPKDEE